MMKKIALIATMIGVTFLSTVVSSAQSVRQITTSVPFDFSVSGVELPAGEYVITFGSGSISRNSVVIRSADGRGSAVAMVRTESIAFPGEVTGVTFQKINGKYHLEGITHYALKMSFNKPAGEGSGLTLAMK